MITKKSILMVFFLSAILLLVAFWKIADKDRQYDQKIYPNVFIDDKAVGGKSIKDIIALYDYRNRQLIKLNLESVYQNQKIATFSANDLHINLDSKLTAANAFRIGRSNNLFVMIRERLATLFQRQRYDFYTVIEYDKSPLRNFLDNSEEQYNLPAKNALFKFENGKVTSFRNEEKGLVLLSGQFLKDANLAIQSLKNQPKNLTVTLVANPVEPEITLANSNSYGIEEFVAEGKSDYSHSIPGRVHNVLLAASKFNGVLIPKNTVFSFNDIIGDISSTTGYEQAYIIKEGKTVLGDGGGVCQVSTTLFRAALNAGLPIVQRIAHAYRVGYYENDAKPGFDATVYAPYADLKIKNDTPASLLIETEVDKDNNLLTFKFYGKKDNRRVEIGQSTLTDTTPPLPDVFQDDPTLKKGVVKQIDFSAPGGKANFTYKVFKNNQLTIDTHFLSVYQPWAAVYLRGTAD